MDEIRFSNSIEKTEAYMSGLRSSGLCRKGRCDRCWRWRLGAMNMDRMEFVCIECRGADYFENLVGKPGES